MTWAQVLPWLLSAWTLAAMFYASGRPLRGWTLALLGQPMWFAYTFVSADGGGFWPLNVGLTIIYARNIRKAWQGRK